MEKVFHEQLTAKQFRSLRSHTAAVTELYSERHANKRRRQPSTLARHFRSLSQGALLQLLGDNTDTLFAVDSFSQPGEGADFNIFSISSILPQ